MSLKFNCPTCGVDLIIQFLKAGEIARCRNCGTDVVVPGDAEHINWDSSIIRQVKETKDQYYLTPSQPEQKPLKLPWKETFNYLWTSIKGDWVFFAEIIFVYAVIKFISMAFEGYSFKTPLTYAVPAAIIFISLDAFINMSLIQASLKYQTKKSHEYKYLFPHINRYLKYLAAELMYYLIIATGLFLLIFPGIIWAVKFQFYSFLIVHKNIGPIEALKQSAKLTDRFKLELFPLNFLLLGINFLGRLTRIGHFFTWPLSTYTIAYVYRWLAMEKGFDISESNEKYKEAESVDKVELDKRSKQAFPTIPQAAILTFALLLMTLVIFIQIYFIDSTFDTDFSDNIFFEAFSTLFIFGVIIVYGFKRTGKALSEIFPLRFFNPLILIPLIVTVIGTSILLSEVDNLINVILPMPKSLLEIFEDLFQVPLQAVFFAIIIAPITEETFFRGIILNGFLENYSPRKAVIVSSLLFGIIHFNPWQFTGAFILGMLFAWCYIQTRSLLPCLIGHAIANSIPLIAINLDIEISGFTGRHAQGIVFQPWWFDLIGIALTIVGILWLYIIFKKDQEPKPSS